MKIAKVHGRQILDSRGNPTVEAEVTLESGAVGRASVPSGVSTGGDEAQELRDKDPKEYGGMGEQRAVDNVNGEIAGKLTGMDAEDQRQVDMGMCELDGTGNKSRLGANAILAVSLAIAKAVAEEKKIPLYKHIKSLDSGMSGDGVENEAEKWILPLPQMNIINGGKHAMHSTDIQEFMIMPVGAKSFEEAVRMGSEIFHCLGEVLEQTGYSTTVGDEGGYAPAVRLGNQEALNMIDVAVQKAGYLLGDEIEMGLDLAATAFYEDGQYDLKVEGRKLSSDGTVAWLDEVIQKYSVVSLEDGLAENDWQGWVELTRRIGDKAQIVGDDLLESNIETLKKGIAQHAANAILVKVNQIGTLSETIDLVKMAHEAGWKAIVSHRSGETEDVTIAHLAVGLGTGQIKTGSLSRSERVAKYNELLRIEEELGDNARYAGRDALKRANKYG